MQIHTVNPIDDPDWDRRMLEAGNDCFFHSRPWAQVLCDTYRFRPMYLEPGGTSPCGGLLPLMETHGPFGGRSGSSLPFSDLSPVQGAPDVRRELVHEAVRMGKTLGWKELDLRCGHLDEPGSTASTTFYTHSVKLGPDASSMFNLMQSPTRRAVRKAEACGITVAFGTSWKDLRSFYRLHCRTRRRHGLPPQSQSFFRSIHERIVQPGRGFVASAIAGGNAVAAAVFFIHGSTAVFKFGASDEKHLGSRPNDAILWESMRHLSERGILALHLGRTNTHHDGLRRFKLGFGATETNYSYYRIDLEKDIFLKEIDRTTGWHTRVFRNMPIWFNRVCGSVLYRYGA